MATYGKHLFGMNTWCRLPTAHSKWIDLILGQSKGRSGARLFDVYKSVSVDRRSKRQSDNQSVGVLVCHSLWHGMRNLGLACENIGVAFTHCDTMGSYPNACWKLGMFTSKLELDAGSWEPMHTPRKLFSNQKKMPSTTNIQNNLNKQCHMQSLQNTK